MSNLGAERKIGRAAVGAAMLSLMVPSSGALGAPRPDTSTLMRGGVEDRAFQAAIEKIPIKEAEQFSFVATFTATIIVGSQEENCDFKIAYNPFESARMWTATGGPGPQCLRFRDQALEAWQKHTRGEYAVAGMEPGEKLYDCFVLGKMVAEVKYQCKIWPSGKNLERTTKLLMDTDLVLYLDTKKKYITKFESKYNPPKKRLSLSKINILDGDGQLMILSNGLPRLRSNRIYQEGVKFGTKYKATINIEFKYRAVSMD